jgi:hypothetical protein
MRSFLLDVVPRLDAHIAGLGLEDFAVDNHPDQSIAALAHSILDRLGWPGAASPA